MHKFKVLVVIPARGGSKRLPRKNILPLNGKPMINWTIDAALGVPDVTKVMVSTDCEKIAEVARNAGAEVPFLRPESLSNDTSSSTDVVRHVLEYYQENGEVFDYVLLLQPTSPLRSANDIKSAIGLLKEKCANSVVSVTECEHSPLWCNVLDDSLSMENFIKTDMKNSRSQDLPTYYRLNGAIYLTNVSDFLEDGLFITRNKCFAYVMPSLRSIDIDHKLDYIIAEAIMKESSNV